MGNKDEDRIHTAMGSVGRGAYHMGVKAGLMRALECMSEPASMEVARAAVATEIQSEARLCDAHVHAVLDEFEDHVFPGSRYRVIPPTAACVSFQSALPDSGAEYEVRCGCCNVGGTAVDDDGLDDFLNKHRLCSRIARMNDS